ncbi:MAG: tRNA 2-thiouridine(34) synthase MnmA [Phycisphaerales bacterium]|nr:MAG: tRNA 2-thiouridine(34) synthase MnmA [Phycisphaerales bacterium]
MTEKRGKVVVAMSGGVDSSVTACLLVEQGYDVMGLFMRVGAEAAEPTPEAACATASSHQGCCSAADAGDARLVAGILGIPFYSLNFEAEFDRLIEDFADEYVRGRTPNPCIVCNDRLKFRKLLDYADAVGAGYVATGHYARIGPPDGPLDGGDPRGLEPAARNFLMRGRDPEKDQSYVLFGLEPKVLDRVLFPIGGYNKTEVRELADRFDLPNRDKPDSQEICFAPDRDYARVVKQRRPDAFVEGDVVNTAGDVVGRHKGIGHYTIGQRRGLGIAAGRPIYVTQLDVPSNTVTVGDGDDLLRSALVADKVRYLVAAPSDPFHADVKIRYLHKAAPATVYPLGGDQVRVVFDNPQRAITPGQAVVFYNNDVVIGGGWIDRAESGAE